MEKNLPLYELKINPEAEAYVEAIALVDAPAIESDFIAFSKQQENITFATDEDRMELIGAAMIPDIKIYRRDNNGQEYNVFFSKETVREIAQTFFMKGFQQNLNLDHTATPAHSFIYQSYIVDNAKGMTSPKGLNLPDGSWVVGVKVQDEKVWSEIKEGKKKGFSVEGLFEFFNVHKQKSKDEEVLNMLQSLYKQLIKSTINNE